MTLGEPQLRGVYDAFNARDIDAVLAHLHPDVDWPNAWEGGRVHGHAGVREYWTRQWQQIDSRADPVAVRTLDDGRVAIDVDQTVRDLAGALIAQNRVTHVYTIRDGLITRMDVEEPT
jgi:ketosteroid isomerase-like protein